MEDIRFSGPLHQAPNFENLWYFVELHRSRIGNTIQNIENWYAEHGSLNWG